MQTKYVSSTKSLLIYDWIMGNKLLDIKMICKTIYVVISTFQILPNYDFIYSMYPSLYPQLELLFSSLQLTNTTVDFPLSLST